MEEFYQGYRLREEDLNTEFWRQNIHYPPPLTYLYSPYWVRYSIGWIHPTTGIRYRIGPFHRLPDEVQTGVFRPNLVIGDAWATGTYEIRWFYMDFDYSSIEERRVRFTVLSAGIANALMDYQDYFDLPALLTVV